MRIWASAGMQTTGGRYGGQMVREQLMTLLQTSIVFLLLTNAASLAAAVYAVRRIGPSQSPQDHKSAIERNAEAMLRRAS
jgi:hypothetical protein